MAWRFLGRPGRPWRNWSRNLKAWPERVFYPKTRDDLVAIIQLARTEKKKIRVAGRSHTWAPLVPTDDYLVFTKHLKGIDVDLSDPARPLVTVAPGTTIEEMNEACRENGLVFPTNVVPTDFTMAAVAATGCHGTGIVEETVPDYVEAIEIIDAEGRLRRYTPQGVQILDAKGQWQPYPFPDPQGAMNAARLNLGVLGIIWRTTFRVLRAFHVRQLDDNKVDMESAIGRFQEYITGHDYAELVWWPYNRTMWVKLYDRVESEAKDSFCRHCVTMAIQRVMLVMGRVVYGLLTVVPWLSPPLLRLMYRFSTSTVDKIVPLEWAIHYQAGIRIIRATNAEVCFPIDADFANVQEAWRIAVAKVREYHARGTYPLNMGLVGRFVRGSGIPLSPAYGDGLMCFIELMSFADTPDWVPFSTDVLTEWLKIPQARPHWAKEMRQFKPALMREKYGNDLRHFLETRDALGVDRYDMFVNDYLEQVFFGGP